MFSINHTRKKSEFLRASARRNSLDYIYWNAARVWHFILHVLLNRDFTVHCSCDLRFNYDFAVCWKQRTINFFVRCQGRKWMHLLLSVLHHYVEIVQIYHNIWHYISFNNVIFEGTEKCFIIIVYLLNLQSRANLIQFVWWVFLYETLPVCLWMRCVGLLCAIVLLFGEVPLNLLMKGIRN